MRGLVLTGSERFRWRHGFTTLGCAGLLASAAAAQSTGTLRGLVVNSVTRQPIARVLVTPMSASSSELAVMTDASGHFTLSNLPAGPVQLRIRRPGYFDPATRQEEAVHSVLFVLGGAEATFALEPAATLQGQVVLPEGEPPSGIRVELLQAAVSSGHRYWRLRETLVVESDGSFEFAGLDPGSYLLHSQASLDPVPEQGAAQTRSGYLPMFAPASRQLESASPLLIEPGQTTAVKLQLQRAAFHPVSIKVAGAGDLFPNLQVSGDGFTHWPTRFDRQSGTATVELPSGDYTLNASGGRRGAVSGTLPLHIAEGTPANLSITINQAQPSTIVTHVVSTATSSAPNNGSQLAQLTLLPIDAPEAQPLNLPMEREGNSDTAVIRNGIPPGRYWVEAVAGSGYVVGLASRGTNLLTEVLSVSPGTPVDMDATLRDDSGSLTVSRAGELLQGESVIQVLPLFPGGRATVQSGSSDGSPAEPVSFANLAPGDYLLLATRSLVGIAYREPGVLQELGGTRVTVTAGAPAQVTLSTLSSLPPGITGAP